MGRLPGADDHLADPAHRLRVGAHHADDAAIVEHVLGADRLGPDAALGESHVLGNVRDRWWQTISMSRCSSIVLTVNGRVGLVLEGRTLGWPAILMMSGSMAAAGAFGVEAVDRPALDGRDRVVEEPALVQRVGVDGDLDVVLVGHRQAGVDDRQGGAPVLVELQAAGAGLDLISRAASAGCRCPCRGCRR